MKIVDKTNKRGMLKVMIISMIIISIVVLVGFAFARYITRLNGSTQVPIAQWNFKVTAGSSQSLDIDLANTRYPNDTTEVDRTKVAPGTAGALQLNINATGSQVSLKYDIDLTLTQIPENLIFYSDAEMTKALYKDNGVIHLDGYFGASDTNKTATQNLYWQWKLETGSTQDEINANDLLDSEWIGDRIVLGVQATGRQVMDSPTTQYAVTFDLNGGTLANHGDSTQIMKNVNYGGTYGSLPIPTREGYTFMGWNGKNLVNKNTIIMDYEISGTDIAPREGWFVTDYIKVIPGETYTLSGKSQGIDTLYYDANKENPLLKKDGHPGTITIPIDKEYIRFNGLKSHKDTIQFEEGSTATAYEPYYITESTEVVQNQNHTLTAIWEPNS